MAGGGRLGEAREFAHELSRARRLALGRILRPRAQAIQDDTVGHAYRATNFLGLGAVGAKRWAAVTSRSVPKFLDAIEAGDDLRTRLLDQVSTYITELRAAGFQRFAVKPLVNLAFRLSLAEVKTHAKAEGFDPEDLEDELRLFLRAFEARIVYRS